MIGRIVGNQLRCYLLKLPPDEWEHTLKSPVAMFFLKKARWPTTIKGHGHKKQPHILGQKGKVV